MIVKLLSHLLTLAAIRHAWNSRKYVPMSVQMWSAYWQKWYEQGVISDDERIATELTNIIRNIDFNTTIRIPDDVLIRAMTMPHDFYEKEWVLESLPPITSSYPEPIASHMTDKGKK